MAIREQLIRMTPARFVALLLTTIFVAESGIMLVLPVIVSTTHASSSVAAGVDAFLLVVVLAPGLWWMIIRPLQGGIVSEQQRAAAIMHGAFHGIITIDEAGSVESVNPAAERLFGYREEELLGRPLTLLMPERYRERHLTALDLARSTAAPPHQARRIIEVEGLRKDGSELQVELSLTAWQSAGARKYAGFVRDITARKQAESALRDSEQRYRAVAEQLRETSEYLENLFDSANAPIIVWNPALRITRFNRACERLTGYAASEAVGLELRMLFPAENREDSLSKIVHALGGEELESPEIPILRKDGEIRIALWNSANIRSGDGTAVATIAQGKDITLRRQVEVALRESEEKFRSLFESSRDAIVTLEPPSWRFTSGNPAAVKIFGVKNEEELVSYGPDDLSPGRQPDGRASAEKARQMIEAAVRGGSQFFEWTHQRIDGGEFAADVLLNRIERGRTVMLQATVRDISERKQAEQMKADFVSFATHQLRTPLSGIRWLLELAEQGEGLPEEVASLVVDARLSAERLIRLVNDLLAVSRIEGGQLAVEPQPVDLSAMTTGVVNELMPLVREKNQQFSLPDGVPAPRVYADPKLVREVVLNLLSNAIKYTPNDGSITVSMKADGDTVQWAVRDTGIGVPVAAERRLFEKFYRAENATVINTEGTGLGLYLVRLVLERLGGRVWCESEEGRGSTFTFTLPIAREGAASEGP